MPRPNDRRMFLGGAIAGLAAGSMTGSVQAQAPATSREGLYPDGVQSADVGYSPGILGAGSKVICVSGQGPDDVTADMETQMRQTFERIGKVLAEAGASFENVVMMRSYFVHLKRDLPIYRKVRLEYLKKPYPASTAVGTTELAIEGLDIEIEAIAVI